ncbi:MAG: hypothetical protein F4X66_09580 [Chloroflexi bacterium]|nr:hypothetical protein [Chloroflexota bacterium]MYE38943.1 hypothetical protein [Chloroflexota bacterium]
MLYLAGLVVVVGFALAFWWLFVKGNTGRARGSDLMELRQAENKVKVSDPILRRDIDILERYGSDLLQDAIELRRAQILRGEHPDSPSSSQPPR